MVGEQPEVSIRRDEGEDPLSLPALEPNTWVETDIIKQARILEEKGKTLSWFDYNYSYFFYNISNHPSKEQL